ncbi:MAG: SUMF1/EgtB/PvdO family nonheme iron enzyme [Burkholderiales bacterium]|nr:SUMF1/EgtB/PvdO family nonheme iron enzyme [Anaerolineae bacterium]
MARIFISYSRKDAAQVAQDLANRLRAMDHIAFVDTQSMRGGVEWRDELAEQIRQSHLMVLLVTPESNASANVGEEIEQALKNRKTILPIRINNAPLPKHLHDINARNVDANNIDGIIVEIARAMPQDHRTFYIVAVVLVAFALILGLLVGPAISNMLQRSTAITQTAITNTPVVTSTDVPEATQAAHPEAVQNALEGARNFTGGNTNWEPFFYIFPEDLSGAQMALVPSGEFLMGSENGEPDESPTHRKVMAEAYWIDQTEVTRAQYQQCLDVAACMQTSRNQYSTRDNQPLNGVTWFQAGDYCNWRGMHLPTEVEWEYAARGPDGLTYPWGNTFDENYLVYSLNARGETADVGDRRDGASWVGALDMSGNVWEWVSSLYFDYPYGSDHERDSDDGVRVLRGGSFGNDSLGLRATDRDSIDPFVVNDYIGFRCARSVE